MAILDDVKVALRINATSLDGEISDLILACRADLELAGILNSKTIDDTEPLIKRAIIIYCKANFGLNNSEADRFQNAYNLLKTHLLLSADFTGGDA